MFADLQLRIEAITLIGQGTSCCGNAEPIAPASSASAGNWIASRDTRANSVGITLTFCHLWANRLHVGRNGVVVGWC